MTDTGLGTAILIIFIIMLIHFALTASIGIAHIKNNWQDYKCKPGIIPFAAVFGHSTSENFKECVKETQVDFMQVFLEPIYSSLSFFAESGSMFANIFKDVKVFGNAQEKAGLDMKVNMENRVMGVLNETNNMYINTVDTFSKLGQSMTLLYYSALSGINMGIALYAELPGTLVRFAGSLIPG